MSTRRRVGLVALLAALGCSSGEGSEGTVTVFAAASLTDAFTEMAGAFEQSAGVDVQLNFGPSSALRNQILEGAPADVFAPADEANMEAVVEGGEAEDPTVFARNRLEIAVPAGNPGAVEGRGDFADPDLLIGLCAEEVPCGRLAREVLARAGVEPAVDTNEPDVRALLTKIASGDLDAGLVYRTDVRAAGSDVDGIGVPGRAVETLYPISVLERADDSEPAAVFVDFVLSDAGQAILRDAGFQPP